MLPATKSLQRGRACSALLFFLLAGGGLGYAIFDFFQHRKALYRSEAKILVKSVFDRGTRNIPDKVRDPAEDERVIATEVELATSSDLLLQAADAVSLWRFLDPDDDPASEGAKEQALQRVQNRSEVYPLENTTVLYFSFSDSDEELAKKFLNEWVNRYIRHHLKIHRRIGSAQSIQRDLDQAQSSLFRVEDELTKALVAQDEAPNQLRLEKLRTQREKALKEVSALEKELAEARLDEQMDPLNSPNLSIIQKPTEAREFHPKPKWERLLKFGGGGLLTGLIAVWICSLFGRPTSSAAYGTSS